MNKAIFFSILLCIVCIFCTCKKDKSECLTCPPPPPDTTSHTINWQEPDTLGTQGLIRDVWVFSQNKAIAVGQIFLQDSTGQIDQSNPYIGAEWDGQKWTKIKLTYVYNSQSYIFTEVNGIWVVGNSDYWFAAGSVFHWDGQSSQAQLVFSRLTLSDPNATVEKIWGVSGTNMFGVGKSGTIVHYDGHSWTKMASNTTVDLQDIWGIDGSHIWATGFNNSDGHCVVLQCNGTSWSTIYDSANLPPNKIQYFNTVWTDNVSSLYLDGGSYTQILNLQDGTFKRTDSLSTNEVFKIRGTKHNDIFRVGYGGETVHYNGATWHLYPELKTLNGGTAWFYSVFPTSDMVMIGGLFPTALNGFPVVVRGYR
jgi:hypothetical protein